MANMFQPFLLTFLFIFLLVYHTPSAQAGCGGDRTKEYGTFGATGYDAYNSNGQRCEWKVQVARGRNILLIFYYFQLNQELCDYEKVEVYNLPSNQWAPKKTYCGSATPLPLVSAHNRMKIVYQSNDFSGVTGFGATYFSTITKTECGGKMSELAGSFVSPGFPSAYHYNENCTWQITVARGRIITLNFIEFDIEVYGTSSSCVHDSVKVYDGQNYQASQLGKFCGNRKPDPLTSSRNSMLVHFRSDYSSNKKGFHAAYYSTVVTCQHPTAPAHGDLKYDSRTTYLYGDEVEVICSIGYNLRDKDAIKCQADGSWSVTESFCQAVPCGHPTAPVNARLTNSGTTYHYEDQVEITCNLGYRLNGNNTITCEADGRWSVIELFCERQEEVATPEKSLKSTQTQTGLKSLQTQTVTLGIILGLALLVIAGLVIYIVLNRCKKSEDAIEMHDRNANHISAGTTLTNMTDAAELSISTNRFSNQDEVEIEDNLYYDSFEASGGSQQHPSSTTAAAGQRGPITGDIYATVNKTKQENLYANM